MEKGPFSVEWLAQSSRGGAQPAAAARRPRSPSGDTGGQESPADLGESPPGPLVAAVRLTVPARETFSAAQLQELERSFREQRYIGASEKRRLAAVLNLSQSQIKTWFQNRRMKFKRQTQDAR
ncbi:Homeobox protein vex1, partial [Eudyptula minor]